MQARTINGFGALSVDISLNGNHFANAISRLATMPYNMYWLGAAVASRSLYAGNYDDK